MRRGFVRTLWGDYGDPRRLFNCRGKMDDDISLIRHNKYEYQLNPTYYIFGENNFKLMQDMGFNCKLLDKRPFVYGENESMFKHKIDAYVAATDDFDEFVFLDLDCMLIKPLPDDFWERCYEKEAIQGSLMIYHKRKAKWRKSDTRKIPCACYMYFRNKEMVDGVLRAWEKSKMESEEVAAARFMDEYAGGWKGLDYYWENFEPDFYAMSRNIVYDQKDYVYKDLCFHHFHENSEVTHYLDKIAKKDLPEWAKEICE